MKISKKELERWKENTLETALKLGYRQDILEKLKTNVSLEVIRNANTSYNEGVLYGFCR